MNPELLHPDARRPPGVFLLLGPSGSGKGTLAEGLLAAGLADFHISMGDLLRGLIARVRSSPKERQALEAELPGEPPAGFASRVDWLIDTVEDGRLVPDAWTQKLIEEELKRRSELRAGRWVLDGYPRRVDAARHLLQTLNTLDIPVLGVVHLRLPLEAVRTRLLGRGRADDTSEAIEQRYGFYRQSVLPTVGFLRGESGDEHVWEIDASGTPGEVAEDVWARILAGRSQFFLLRRGWLSLSRSKDRARCARLASQNSLSVHHFEP